MYVGYYNISGYNVVGGNSSYQATKIAAQARRRCVQCQDASSDNRSTNHDLHITVTRRSIVLPKTLTREYITHMGQTVTYGQITAGRDPAGRRVFIYKGGEFWTKARMNIEDWDALVKRIKAGRTVSTGPYVRWLDE